MILLQAMKPEITVKYIHVQHNKLTNSLHVVTVFISSFLKASMFDSCLYQNMTLHVCYTDHNSP